MFRFRDSSYEMKRSKVCPSRLSLSKQSMYVRCMSCVLYYSYIEFEFDLMQLLI